MKHADIIQRMTLLEKAALLSGKNTWLSQDIPRLQIPSISCADGPHGVRKQLGAGDHLGLNESEKATCFPVAAAVANSWDVGLAEEIGCALGEEAAALGVDVLLGPGLNIKRNPLCGRNFEYFSEDPHLSGKIAAAYIRGIQNEGVAACPKHFAANNQELGRMVSDSIMDERTLREIYLTGFEIAVKEGNPGAVMTSYNLVNGTYANDNEHLLTDILRGEWGFDNAVITDWGGSNDHIAGIKAGSTLEMPGPVLDSVREVVAAAESGLLDEAVLDKRVDELLCIALAKKSTPLHFDTDAHHALAQRAAEESIVLLKNEDGILPVRPSQKVAVIGDFIEKPRYQGAGSSMVNPTRLDTTLDCLNSSGLEYVGYASGYQRSGEADERLKASALQVASIADTVLLYLGLSEICEVEGLDRADMNLPANQIELLEAIHEINPNIVVILSAGSALDVGWAHKCKAILHGYLSGQAGAMAALNTITGKINPSGKLAETYPPAYEQVPSAGYYPARERTAEYREGIYVGYRYYDTAGLEVAFPFGHGLSYTSFAYSDLLLAADGASFTLTNTGDRDGAEIVQLYVSKPDALVYRPQKELKGFRKVLLKAGQSARVHFPLDGMAFRYFNTLTGCWEIEAGSYQVHVAASSRDIRLTGELAVKGSAGCDKAYSRELLPSYYSGRVNMVSDAEFAALLGHPVPPARFGAALDRNSAICQMHNAKSWLARLVYKILSRKKARQEAKGQPDLNILFIYHMPFRSIAKMAGAFVSNKMVDGIVDIVNGHFLRGIGAVISGFFQHRRHTKAFHKELYGTASAEDKSIDTRELET